MLLQGQIVDKDTGEPLPGSTVELWYGNVRLNAVAAGSNGSFSIGSQSTPDLFTITHASYKPGKYLYPKFGDLNRFELERNVVEGEPVIIMAKGTLNNKGLLWLLGIGLFLVFIEKKRK